MKFPAIPLGTLIYAFTEAMQPCVHVYSRHIVLDIVVRMDSFAIALLSFINSSCFQEKLLPFRVVLLFTASTQWYPSIIFAWFIFMFQENVISFPFSQYWSRKVSSFSPFFLDRAFYENFHMCLCYLVQKMHAPFLI